MCIRDRDNRLTKNDLLAYIKTRNVPQEQTAKSAPSNISVETKAEVTNEKTPVAASSGSMSGDVEIIEMDRMRRLIADHMVMSMQTSPHVTSFVEVDVTNIVRWRERVKKEFISKYGQNITYTPIFIEAVVLSLIHI